MPLWFMHLRDSQLGNCWKKSLPQQANPCNKNWLQVSLFKRTSSLVNRSSNVHPTSRQWSCTHYAMSHFLRNAMSIWIGGNVRNNHSPLTLWSITRYWQENIFQTTYLLAKHASSSLKSLSILPSTSIVTLTIHQDLWSTNFWSGKLNHIK